MAATTEDLARLLVSIELSQSKFEKQAAAIAKSAERAAKKIDGDFKQANDNVSQSFDRGSRQATASLGQTRAAVSNLSFQLNDIAMGLASGTSPFTIMIQQGSQVAQALGGAGGGLRGAVTALGGAFASMVNPVSLASFALIGLTGVAFQYFTGVESNGKKAKAELDEHLKLIEAVAQKWGDALPALTAYADKLRTLKDSNEILAASGEAAKAAFADVGPEIERLRIRFGGVVAQLQGKAGASFLAPLNAAFTELVGKLRDGTALPGDLEKLQKQFIDVFEKTGSSAAKVMADELGKLAGKFDDAAVNAKEFSDQGAKAAANVTKDLEGLRDLAVAIGTSLTGAGGAGVDAMNAIAEQINSGLTPAMRAVVDYIKQAHEAYTTMQRDIERTPLGTLSPLVSGGGKFLNPAEFQQFTAERTLSAEHAANPKEFLRSRAVSERIAGRIDAIDESFAKGLAQVLAQFPELRVVSARRTTAEQAAIYNSGVRPAAKPGHSLHERGIAADLGLAGGGEPTREFLARLYAAARQAGIEFPVRGDPFHAQPIGASGRGTAFASPGAAKRTPDDIFKGSVEQVQARIAMLNAEIEAQGKLNPLVNDYGFAVTKARIEQDLLNDAKRAGLEITPALSGQIDALATNYARLEAQQGRNKAAQDALNQAQQEFAALGKDVVGGFIRDLMAGKSAAEALSNALQKVADKLLDMALNSLFDGPGGLGGLFGAFFGGGAAAAPMTGLFADGGYTGKGGKNEPAGVVHRGEYVFSKAAVDKIGAGNLEAMHRNLKGYSAGGLVAPSVPQVGRGGAVPQGLHITVGTRVGNNGNIQPYVDSVVQRRINHYDKTQAPQTAVKSVQQYQQRAG